MKKPVYLLVACMLILGIFQTTLTSFNYNVEASPPPPSDLVNGTQYIEGDWLINGTEVFSNEIIILSGNLTVQSGTSLTLINVTLAMNCTTDNGLYTIEVLSGGSLIITDGDNDPATKDDRSNITDSPFDTDDRSPSDYRTAIRINDGASLFMNNTIVRECGYSGGGQDVGLYIDGADYINIQNCTFVNNAQAIAGHHSDNSVIGYNEIRNSDEFGVNIVWGWYLRFFNNNIHHNDFGAFIGAYYSVINDNYIHNNSNVYSLPWEQDKDGLRIWWAGNTDIYNLQ
jgi:parallel beta-helix repeat protein